MLRKLLLFTTLLLVAVVSLVQAQQLQPLPLTDRSPVELLINGGFETDLDTNKLPDGWKATGTSFSKSDKVKCDKLEKPVAHSGSCAFMFRGNSDGSGSNLTQKVTDVSAVTDGMSLQFSAQIDPRSGIPGTNFGKATIKLSDGDSIKLVINIPGGNDRRDVADYQQVSMSHTLSLGGLTVTKIKAKLLTNQPAGKFLIDDVTLTVFDPGATETPTATTTIELTNTPTPTTVPPVCTPVICQLTAEDGAASDYFGGAVAYDGNNAIVGTGYENNGRGAAYVFNWDGSTWTEQQKLTASDAADLDFFGWSVAIDGNTVVVGAYRKNTNQGAAYVFTWDGLTWTEQQKLTPAVPSGGAYFGYSVGISGDTAIIGAYGRIDLRGAVYVFTRTANTWTEQQTLTASDPADEDHFGFTVDLDGDTAAIGAYGKDNKKGAVYIFHHTANTWSEQQKLTPQDPENNAEFGKTVALSGDSVLIGAPFKNGASNDHGAAYVFTRTEAVWSFQQKLTASDTTAFDLFGMSVAIAGDTAVIGSPGRTAGIGAAYIFTRSASVWSEQVLFTPLNLDSVGDYGSSVALDGNSIIVGVPSDDIGENADQGSAWVYSLE